MPATHKSPSPVRRKHNANAARAMRHTPTSTEEVAWQYLRNRQLAGLKFRRQHSIDRFIVDFYCAEAQLVIEIDGPIHDAPNYDAERQQILETMGLRILRFTNGEVLKSIEDVLAQIKQAAGTDQQPPDTETPQN